MIKQNQAFIVMIYNRLMINMEVLLYIWNGSFH